VLTTLAERVTSGSAVASNSTRLDTETRIYQARFNTEDWSGQLLAYTIQPDGTLGAIQWDAGQLIPAANSRDIYTQTSAGTAVPFDWASLGAAEQAALDIGPGGMPDGLGEKRAAWLRGDQSFEQSAGGSFRTRNVILGDTISSNPRFVGAENFGFSALPSGTPGQDTYAAFLQSKVNVNGEPQAPMLYVGANDGMLHGIDAATGVEHFAYVPQSVYGKLSRLTDPNYAHEYFVDGQVFVGDAYIDRNGTQRWASILVGTTGAGARSVFALDVTNPHGFSASDVMWEFEDPDLGYTISQPVVARMASGQWVAVFGNGYNSDNHSAVLFVVDLETGTLIRKIDTGVGDAANPNGLATPALLPDGTRTIRSIYGGDLHGNLWKFDVSQSNTGNWDVAFRQGPNRYPLFTATDAGGNPQPITAPVEIGLHPDGGYMIYFGTGKYFETTDNVVPGNPQVESFYGVWDQSGNNPTRITGARSTALTEQEIQFEGDPGGGSQFNVRVTSGYPVDWNTKRGWFLDLESPVNGPEGERVVDTPLLRGGRVIFTTLIPSGDPCSAGGTSWLMELDAINGRRLLESPLDINEDGEIDSDDFVSVIVDGEYVTVPISGVQSREGIVRTPAVISAGEVEYKITSGTTGAVDTLRETGAFQQARASWRQLR
jgi:type IV pilus assembly protein PilY1